MILMNQSVVSIDNIDDNLHNAQCILNLWQFVCRILYTEPLTDKNYELHVSTRHNFSTQYQLILAMRRQFALHQKVVDLLSCVLVCLDHLVVLLEIL